jgi:RNA polymerase primary sigma factor
VFLRGIIDLEATYAGPDAKGVPVMPGADGQAPNAAAPQTAAPATAPAAPTPFRAKPQAVPWEQEPTDPPEGELDENDLESSMSLAAIEAELKPKMLETFDNVADSYKRLRRLQDRIARPMLSASAISVAPMSCACISRTLGILTLGKNCGDEARFCREADRQQTSTVAL